MWKYKTNPVYSSFPENVEKDNIKKLIETYEGLDPLKCFSLFFDDTVLHLIVNFSLKYVLKNSIKNKKSFQYLLFIILQLLT